MTIEALSLGAVDCIDKEAYSLMDFKGLRGIMLERILAVAHANVSPLVHSGVAADSRPKGDAAQPPHRYELAVFGASTGGPRAIETVLAQLGPDVRAPIAIVQHMPKGFTSAFAERLDRCLPLAVREASDGDRLEPGTVHIARAGRHLRISQNSGEYYAALSASPRTATHRPSVDVLFSSAAKVAAPHTVAVLLTGMGTDGADGMAKLHAAGAHTIAQSARSCVVYGMPRAAVELDAVRESLPLEQIAGRLTTLLTPVG